MLNYQFAMVARSATIHVLVEKPSSLMQGEYLTVNMFSAFALALCLSEGACN